MMRLSVRTYIRPTSGIRQTINTCSVSELKTIYLRAVNKLAVCLSRSCCPCDSKFISWHDLLYFVIFFMAKYRSISRYQSWIESVQVSSYPHYLAAHLYSHLYDWIIGYIRLIMECNRTVWTLNLWHFGRWNVSIIFYNKQLQLGPAQS